MPKPPLTIPSPLCIRNSILFKASDDVELELRNPIFGDNHNLELQITHNRNKSHNLFVFRKSTWPKNRQFNITIDNITDDKLSEIRAFYLNYCGQEVTYTDYDDREWLGIILNVNEPIVHGRFSTCGMHTVVISFYGALV